MTKNLKYSMDEIYATPIGAAVLPLRSTAIVRARQDAINQAHHVAAILDANGWDLNKAAPAPNPNAGRYEYQMAHSKRRLYQFLTDRVGGHAGFSRTAPIIVQMSAEKIERSAHQAEEMAALQYDCFVYKLTQKIGPVVDARLDGDHVWGYSHLFVTTVSGEKQVWRTQQIVNTSKLGNLFNQWPTRRIKTKGE